MAEKIEIPTEELRAILEMARSALNLQHALPDEIRVRRDAAEHGRLRNRKNNRIPGRLLLRKTEKVKRLIAYIPDHPVSKILSPPVRLEEGSEKQLTALLGITTRHMSGEQLAEYDSRIDATAFHKVESRLRVAQEVVEGIYTEVVFDCLCGDHIFALRWNAPCTADCPVCRREYAIRLAEKPKEKVVCVRESAPPVVD